MAVTEDCIKYSSTRTMQERN